MKIVLGFGISGRAAAQLLRNSSHEPVCAVDRKAYDLKPIDGVSLVSEDDPIDWTSVSEVIVSPGIGKSHPHLQQAALFQIPICGEIDLACRFVSNHCCIGITGTNGKTTTTLLIAHILNHSGRCARALGNVGEALADYVRQQEEQDILVLELSSYQLETLHRPCLDLGVLLNITPNHLDRYDSLLDYGRAKCRIRSCLKPHGKLFVSEQVAEEYVEMASSLRLAHIPVIGYTHLGEQNVQAAFSVCRELGLDDQQIAAAVATFKKPSHRIEFVGEYEGVRFYNDSKATNLEAVMHAVKLLPGPIVLLAGGRGKGASYDPWMTAFREKVVAIVCFGEAAAQIEKELGRAIRVRRTVTLREALLDAMREALAPCTIVLSPGCSSLDQYRNYEQRGNEFKAFVEEKIWIEKKQL